MARARQLPIYIILTIALILAAQFVLAWTNPTQSPPNGNVSLPSAQWTASSTAIYNSNSGNVGIGITGPGQKLSVAGTIESTSGGFRFPDGTVQARSAAFVGAQIYKSADVSISNGVDTVVTFNSEDWDTHAFHDTSTNSERITIPSGQGGRYMVYVHVSWDSTLNAGYGQAYIRKNGAVHTGHQFNWPANGNTGFRNQSYTFLIDLVTGDYLDLIVSQDSGSAIGLNGGTGYERTTWGVQRVN